MRFFIAVIIFSPFAIKHLSIRKSEIFNYFWMVVVGVVFNILFFFMGLKQAPSINATIIGSAGPIFLIFISMFYLKEKVKKRLLAGSLIGLIGILIVMLKPIITNHGAEKAIMGNFLFFAAMLAGLANVIFARRIIKNTHPTTLTFYSFFISMICFFPFFVSENLSNPFLLHITMQSIIGILFGSLLTTVAAYSLFYWAIKYMPASETGVFIYLDPVIAILIAIPLLHEFPDEFFIAGSVLVFLGIYIAEGRLHWHPLHLFGKKS